MPRKKKETSGKKGQQLSLLEYMRKAGDSELKTLKAMLNMAMPADMWRGTLACPPGTLADLIVNEFKNKTDIPLELPFYQLFHLISGYLLHSGVNVCIDSQKSKKKLYVKPDIWTILLSTSGAGKSFSWKEVSQLATDDIIWHSFTGLKSGAAFIEDLSHGNNNKLAVRDEFNEFYKALLDERGPMADIRDYMLLAHDNMKLERRTKGNQIIVKDPALVILGMCVADSFEKSLSEDDLINGFAQRFSYIIANKDPKRPMKNYPMYFVDSTEWGDLFKKLLENVKYKTYIADDDAIKGYEIAFESLIQYELDDSYMRRVLWKAHKYALIYHILIGNGDKEHLTPNDYGWAARALYLHIIDLKNLLEKHGMSELQIKLNKVEDWCKKRIEKEEYEKMTYSDLVRGVRGLTNTRDARDLVDLAGYEEYFSKKKKKEENEDDVLPSEEELMNQFLNPEKYYDETRKSDYK